MSHGELEGKGVIRRNNGSGGLPSRAHTRSLGAQGATSTRSCGGRLHESMAHVSLGV